jgi:hypothetical protein
MTRAFSYFILGIVMTPIFIAVAASAVFHALGKVTWETMAKNWSEPE